MLLQHYNYLAIKAAQKPHYGLSWGLVGLGHIRCAHSSSSLSLAINLYHLRSLSFFYFLCSNHFGLKQISPRSLIMLKYHIIKIKFWLTLEVLKKQRIKLVSITTDFWTMFGICFPSCVICHSHFFVRRELLTHWKCTKGYNKDMCHTLHPYYAGNDKWDKQSLQHTVHLALKLTLLTARVKKHQSLCEMSI